MPGEFQQRSLVGPSPWGRRVGHDWAANTFTFLFISVQFSSVQLLSSVWLFATPWIAACQASLSITISQSSLKLMSIEWVMPSSHLILCHPLLLLSPIPPSIRVFSNESTLRMRWTKYYCNIIQWCSQGCLGLLLGLPESSLLFFHRMWWENPIELLGPSIDCLSLYYPVSSYLKHFLLLSL